MASRDVHVNDHYGAGRDEHPHHVVNTRIWEDVTQDDEERRRAFGGALRSARASDGKTQKALSDAVGVSQNTISSWEAGELPTQPDVVFRMERELGLPPGWLSRLLGYLPVPAETSDRFLDAIRDDRHLDEGTKRVLAAFYRQLVDGDGGGGGV